jgi:glucan phosphoethanolaminetransferase (alkaline phosphatase superfamily)
MKTNKSALESGCNAGRDSLPSSFGVTMTDKSLRRIVAAVISMLLIFQIGAMISSLFGMAWGVVSAVVVAGVSFFSARIAKAGGKTSAWFLLPTILFTILPLSFTVWKVVTKDATWIDRAIGFGPFIIGFVAPVILLLVVLYELRKRTRES